MNISSNGSKRWLTAAGMLAAGAVAGAVLSGSIGANAATTPSPSASSSSSSQSGGVDPDNHMRGNFPAHGSAEHEALEKPVTGANAASAQAAAVKAVGSGQAGDVTTDATGDGYEVTVTKSDGSTQEVHLNSSFGVAGHGGGFGHGGPDGDADDAAAAATQG